VDFRLCDGVSWLFFCAIKLWLRLSLDFPDFFYSCLSLFLLKEKVTKKFKDNPMAPPVCPANATDALWLLGEGVRGFFDFVGFRLWVFNVLAGFSAQKHSTLKSLSWNPDVW
jgi:hypothetical protein